jgi:hypothetical protein
MCNIYNSLLYEGKYCIKREHSCIARNVLQAHVSALLEVSPSRVPAFRPQAPFLCACSLCTIEFMLHCCSSGWPSQQ